MTGLFKSLLGCALVVGALAVPARAEDFSFSYSNGKDSGSGFLLANFTSTPGTFTIYGITGSADGFTIVRLLPAGTYPDPSLNLGPANDNLMFYPGSPSFDVGGIAYQLSNGTDINLYWDTGTNTYALATVVGNGNLDVSSVNSNINTISIVVAPEPQPLVLVGTAILGLAGVARRRFLRP